MPTYRIAWSRRDDPDKVTEAWMFDSGTAEDLCDRAQPGVARLPLLAGRGGGV